MTTRDLMEFSDALGDAMAVLAFVSQRSGTRARGTLEQFNQQAAQADQAEPVAQLPAPAEPEAHDDDDFVVTGFQPPNV